MLSNICLSVEQMRLGGTNFESWLYRYFFPLVFTVGLIGNAVNLCVLLSPNMRNRANNLLSTLAFVDMAFLLAMLPHSLANNSDFATNYHFRFVYMHTKLELTWLANWTSAAAIWIVLAVSVDRLMGIKSPLYSRKDWQKGTIYLLLAIIFTFTGFLTSYNYFGYKCFRRHFCHGTQLYSICYSIASERWIKNETNPYSHGMKEYVRMSTIANVLLVVILPVVALIALNTALVHELKKQKMQPLLKEKDSFRNTKDRGQERKVALTVCAIVGCFILTQGPSAFILVWNLANGSSPATSTFFYNLRSAANFMVIIGKSTNFFLFCFCSAHFRQRLSLLILRRVSSHNYMNVSASLRAIDVAVAIDGRIRGSFGEKSDRVKKMMNKSKNSKLVTSELSLLSSVTE